MSIWLGIDLVIAITVSWVPLVADYTRFSRDRRSALVGSGVGYFVGASWILVLGVVLVLDRSLTDPTRIPVAVAAGGAAAALALFAVTVDETDEAFANVYSTAVSLQNLMPGVPQWLLILAVSTVATIGALTIDLAHYLDFLYLLGSCFVPLFGVLLADWLVAECATAGTISSPRRPSGPPRSPPGSPGSRSTSGSSPWARVGGPTS